MLGSFEVGAAPVGAAADVGGGGGGGITGTSSVTMGAFTQSASGTVSSGITGSSSIVMGPFTQSAAGTVTGLGAITGTSSVTLGAFTQSAAGAIGATLTIGPFKNKSGAVLANLPIAHLVALSRTSRAVALSLGGLTTNGSGMLVVRDGNLIPGADYMVSSWSTDGASAGNAKVTAAVA